MGAATTTVNAGVGLGANTAQLGVGTLATAAQIGVGTLATGAALGAGVGTNGYPSWNRSASSCLASLWAEGICTDHLGNAISAAMRHVLSEEDATIVINTMAKYKDFFVDVMMQQELELQVGQCVRILSLVTM